MDSAALERGKCWAGVNINKTSPILRERKFFFFGEIKFPLIPESLSYPFETMNTDIF